MNCIILLLLLFCGGNSCQNGCGCGSCGNNSCVGANACGARNRSERNERSGSGKEGCDNDCRRSEPERDHRPSRPEFPNFTPVDDPAFSRRNDGRCETCGCEQNL